MMLWRQGNKGFGIGDKILDNIGKGVLFPFRILEYSSMRYPVTDQQSKNSR
jgi:hypothetical protein